jgi:hypothetical protein
MRGNAVRSMDDEQALARCLELAWAAAEALFVEPD